MAEFAKVVHEWARMCVTLTKEREHLGGSCVDNCPLACNPVCSEIESVADKDIEKAEADIMRWASKHPEPVYPSWGEYLCSIELIHDCKDGAEMACRLFDNPIPADIAEKLGINLKEG